MHGNTVGSISNLVTGQKSGNKGYNRRDVTSTAADLLCPIVQVMYQAQLVMLEKDPS